MNIMDENRWNINDDECQNQTFYPNDQNPSAINSQWSLSGYSEAYHPGFKEEYQNQNQLPLFDATKAVPDIVPDFHCWVEKKECHQYYSEKMKRIYAVMDKIFSVNFGFVNTHPHKEYFIRAQLKYSKREWMKEPVTRCALHLEEHKDDELKQHVLRCETGKPCYEVDMNSYSVKSSLKKSTSFTKFCINYKCMCKSSCKKRLFHILFTLEDARGNILGVQKIDVKVSSAPKRDMDRDEEEPDGPPKKRQRSSEARGHIKDFYNIFKGKPAEKKEMLTWIYHIWQLKKNVSQKNYEDIQDGIKSLALLKP